MFKKDQSQFKKMGNDNFVFVASSCCLLVPLSVSEPRWTVAVMKGVQANTGLSLIVLHARTRVDITWVLPESVPLPHRPSSGAQSRNTDV